jgi:hypothetical protein
MREEFFSRLINDDYSWHQLHLSCPVEPVVSFLSPAAAVVCGPSSIVPPSGIISVLRIL